MKTDILTDQKPAAAKNAGFQKRKQNKKHGYTDDCNFKFNNRRIFTRN